METRKQNNSYFDHKKYPKSLDLLDNGKNIAELGKVVRIGMGSFFKNEFISTQNFNLQAT